MHITEIIICKINVQFTVVLQYCFGNWLKNSVCTMLCQGYGSTQPIEGDHHKLPPSQCELIAYYYNKLSGMKFFMHRVQK